MDVSGSTKNEILKLWYAGYSSVEIGKKLAMSQNTVKSIIKRNAVRKGFCRMCGKELTGRKDKVFCSSSCKYQWHKEKIEQVYSKAKYKCTCSYCHKEFVTYGNKNRKYCSHQCYINARFGEVITEY